MSLRTWKKEFYPVTVKAWTGLNTTPKGKWKGTKSSRDKKALEHGLQKWRGLSRQALARHGVWRASCSNEISDGEETLMINADSCALCKLHIDSEQGCLRCPLFQVLRARCDHFGQPYGAWCGREDSAPMVTALEWALKQVEAKETNNNKKKGQD